MRIYLALAVLFLASPSQASLGSIVLIPSNPTPMDSLRVEAHGSLPNGCWLLGANAECRIDADILLMDLYTYQVYEVCDQSVQPYEMTCKFGHLPVGTYTLIVTEHRISAWQWNPDWKSVTVTVTGSTPVNSSSWGMLKHRYR